MTGTWRSYKKTKYLVSNSGKVFDLNSGEFIEPVLIWRYLRVYLKCSEFERNIYVHRMVMTCFASNPEDKQKIRHINGDFQDNHIDNLEWY